MVNFLRGFFKTKEKYFVSSLQANFIQNEMSECSCKNITIVICLIAFTFLHSLCLSKQESFIKLKENFKLSSWCLKVYNFNL